MVIVCMLVGVTLMAYVDIKQNELDQIENTKSKTTCTKALKTSKCTKKA